MNLLAEATLAKLADEWLLSCVGEDVPLDLAGRGKALVTIPALEPRLFRSLAS